MVLLGCTEQPVASSATPDPRITAGREGSRPTPGASQSWYLPKTLVGGEVAYELRRCRRNPSTGRPDLDVDVRPALVPLHVADYGTRRDIPNDALRAWRTANELSITRYDNGTLKTASGSSSDQTAAVVGNIFSGIAKIASTALGAGGAAAPRAGPGARADRGTADCGEAQALLARLGDLRRRLVAVDLSSRSAASVSEQILRVRERLTITVPFQEEPGAGASPGGELLAIAKPTKQQIAARGWLNAAALDSAGIVEDVLAALSVEVRFVLPKDIEMPRVAALPNDAHYRDPLPLSVIARHKEDVLASALMSFGQFGQPRRFRMRAGLFETLEWSHSFGPDGVPTETSFGGNARAAGATALFGTVIDSSGQIVTAVRQREASRSELSRTTAETQLLEARIALAEARRKYRELEETGGAAGTTQTEP